MRARFHSHNKPILLTLFMALIALIFTTTCSSYAKRSSLDRELHTDQMLYVPFIADGVIPIGSLPEDAYVQTFDGHPTKPEPWQPADWDITVHRRAISTTFEHPMQATHGSDCGAPPASHTIQNFSDAVFLCKDHLMTSIYAEDYGMVYLTPNHLVDFSKGEAVIRFDVSTLRTSSRDWIDLWVTPYDDNLQLPLLDFLPDVNGPPKRSVQIRMDHFGNGSPFRAAIFKDFQMSEVDGNWWTGYEQLLTPDAKRRDTFELRISRTHIKFGMPNYNFWWVDANISDLGWSQGVVQFGHHSYNPLKLCDRPMCAPGTWHWDNVVIAPSVPFTIIRGDRSIISPTDAAQPVYFAKPAPANAHLRFTGVSEKLEVSFDHGATWSAAAIQQQKTYRSDHFQSYWTPVPEGTTSVMFRKNGTDSNNWMVRDPSIWAPPS